MIMTRGIILSSEKKANKTEGLSGCRRPSGLWEVF